MGDDFVPKRHLGLWKEEGRSAWSALLTRWPAPEYLSDKVPQKRTYSVVLQSGKYNSSKFAWFSTHDLSVDCPTPEEARREAAASIDEMIANLRVIAAALCGDPDTDDGEA